MFLKNTQKNRGFTLIELLVVVAIISILASVIMAGLGTTRAKARDAKRKLDMKQVQTALELYYNNNGAYPVTGVAWWGVSQNGGSRATSGANAYIPGLTPNFISELPVDPSGNITGWSGYIYQSNGSQYKFLSHVTGPDSFPAAGQPFHDPVRPTWAWMICSGEPACSTW